MTGQRSAVQNSSDSSAYWPPPAAVAAASAAMPASLSPSDRAGEQADASSMCADTHVGTVECGSGTGPSTKTLAPVPRSRCTSRVRLSSHAWS